MKKAIVAIAVALALGPSARAQKPAGRTESIEVTTTIEAIDHDNRTVTLKDKDGNFTTIVCGPDVKRFGELKVGDKVTMRYYESVAYQIRKPGSAAAPAASGPTVTRSTGKPGATVAQQITATVTIKAIDASVPSVTVLTPDGRTTSFRVQDKNNLTGFKAGDKVEITYTQAFAINVQ